MLRDVLSTSAVGRRGAGVAPLEQLDSGAGQFI